VHVVAACAEPQAKQALREQTDAALRAGVFGVPTMRVGAELFWGYDDFPSLDAYLGGTDPLNRSELARWSRVQPSIQRRPR
jgi:2-hydroxychromene-2-carboxylate isomerase